MKIGILILSLAFCLSCSKHGKDYESIGKLIDDQNAIELKDLSHEDRDSGQVKLIGKVQEVCQAKGCWMTLESETGIPLRVTFKDYGFFVPKGIAGREVIVEGRIPKKKLPEDLARHYAEDAGKPFDSTQTLMEYALVAEGVLLSKSK